MTDNSTTVVEEIHQVPVIDSSQLTITGTPSPPVQEPKTEEPPAPQPTLACPNALYNVNQTCDWIHSNLQPVAENGQGVPPFKTSQEAWDWGDSQMMDQSSRWYMCGYNQMDGQTNDRTPFYYAYMKSCPTE